MQQIEILEKYRLQENGTLSLSGQATKELGWVLGESSCDQYLDEKRQRLIVVAKDAGLTGWSGKQVEGIFSLFRTSPISKRGGIVIDVAARNKFGWAEGTMLKQTLDRTINGIIIEAVGENNG